MTNKLSAMAGNTNVQMSHCPNMYSRPAVTTTSIATAVSACSTATTSSSPGQRSRGTRAKTHADNPSAKSPDTSAHSHHASLATTGPTSGNFSDPSGTSSPQWAPTRPSVVSIFHG